ncbi:rho GTPase-activating protein gacV-like protein [Cinnamomum micranthum f. kanehirae]|uniref:Rho GTPase-activating protein gacV-like protein n=1 Tax=Cinnamomum micranthum f. kanehirae TaxID=337451 RepID=A0A443NMI3_9MAGN|nr:rho GTPase-activating protein gacV-like protein [Cinnamomum micranthum f. kanehirae]
MGIEAKVSKGCIIKGSLVLGMGLCSFLLYRFLPSLFNYLVSSSPIIFCTAILLGTLLSYGQANIPIAKEENPNTVTSATARHADDALVAKTTSSVIEKTTQEAGLRKRSKVLIGDKEKRINGEKKVIEVENKGIRDDGQVHVGSDADSSSPDASVTDVMPVLDELCPLIDSEAPVATTLTPCDESDAQDSDDASADLAADIENADEEEAQEKAIVTWTADDEKNLKDLGTLEIERNQRLENLIAKRRARKKWMVEAEKNLIDLDGNDGMQISIPARRNPFDPLYDLDEIPIPGSAPSILLPRLNPFDLPFEQADDKENPVGENSNHQEFTTFQPRDTFFRRYGSFTVGPSFLGEMKQDRNDFKLRPYFMVEGMPYDTPLRRQFSEKSDSKVSSVPETDTVSSIADYEDDAKELLEQELHQVGDLNSLTNHASDRIKGASEFSEDTDSVLGSNLSDAIEETSEDVHNGLVGAPSYDSSPSAIEGGILHDDIESVSYSENERMEIEPNAEGLWMAPPRLREVDENESKSSRGVRIVWEGDAIQVGMKPEAEHEQGSQNASLSSPAAKSGEEGVMDEKENYHLKVAQVPPGSSQEIHVVSPQIDMAEKANAEGNHKESQDLSSLQSRSTEKTNENLESEPKIGS